MYIPKKMEITDQNSVSTFIINNSFGLLISPSLIGTHLPFVFAPKEGKRGVLYGHVAKANQHWKEFDGQRVLVVFTGPHAYISPTWYKAQHAVPTWNYSAVHCYGVAEILGNEETKLSMETLVNTFEPNLIENKELMPDSYLNQKMQAIVGFKIWLDEIQAKEKLGQHRSQDDQRGVYTALENSTQSDNVKLANYMKKRHIGTGD
ncbi:FMN-binding negative transcriptional regulator [Xenorhabdus sp. PB62.4]|uniref:FMN-binding negative transcriptional regulator n=1 Tax=Xenorhabdus sp. PB62.4 TaxID=1851573 RepID=UPI001656B00B|nr:FMN-binding negative transcriptional regulator [Xenorhabdus sp. PB62.4]MBC8952935.1 transcriptional regulator [Xenorhabdus sp. PB62.4]